MPPATQNGMSSTDGDARDPASIDAAAVGARGDVIEHQFIRAFRAVALGQPNDVAHDTVVAKLHALDDDAIAYVQAGNYALCRNDATSESVISPSSRARPEIAAGTYRALRGS